MHAPTIPLQATTTFIVGEDRRYAHLGHLVEKSPNAIEAIPMILKEVGGGLDLLLDHPKRGKSIGVYGSFVEADKALSAWCWQFVEDNTPRYR